MRQLLFFTVLFSAFSANTAAQCNIAIDSYDEFDSTRLVATQPMNLGYLIVSGNVPEDLEGKEYVEEAKAIFSYSDEKNIRAFFLTLAVAERKFHMIGEDYNVLIKFKGGQVMKLLNVPEKGEFDRNILMWKYLHTCVVPLEIFHMMKNDVVEKIRINYKNYKKTIELEEAQQLALQEAVKCVGQRLVNDVKEIKP
ncbi:MAG TPA: hypothetical protein ENJ95_00410 [Bacteroidetes bacterium]|nr:hypothetical protein [Bacteroidota bacterium]